MSIRIDESICQRCGSCVAVCPGDLLVMRLDGVSLRDERDCWFCLSCAKACPRWAIKGVLPFVLADAGSSLRPEVRGGLLRWVCDSPAGREEFSIAREGAS